MSNYRLTLRSAVSNFPTPFQDVTIGSILSHQQLDNNFITLKSNLIYSGSTNGTGLRLHKINGETIAIDLSAILSPNDTYWTSGSTGNYSVKANNDSTIDARANYSHAEGYGTLANGDASHAEGYGTVSTGNDSHAEGYNSVSVGFASHAEGYNTIASGIAAHSEGNNTNSSGDDSHAEGYATVASGFASHSEGNITIASGENSHSEGYGTISSGFASHAGGSAIPLVSNPYRIVASGDSSFVHFRMLHASQNIGAYGDYSAILGGSDHNINVGAAASVILGGSGHTINSNIKNSIILGGIDIVGAVDDTAYVPHLNISNIDNDNALGNIMVVDTDGTVKFRDSSSLGGTFTGNTSGTCISDIFVSNVHSCSPLTIHGEIQQISNTTIGTNSVAFGTNNMSGYYQPEIISEFVSGYTLNTTIQAPYSYIQFSGDVSQFWNDALNVQNPLEITLYGGSGATETFYVESVFYNIGFGDVTLLLDGNTTGVTNTSHTTLSGNVVTQIEIATTNTFAGGKNTAVYGDNSFVFSDGSIVNGNRSAVLGGQNINAYADDTVYVPYLNVSYLNNDNDLTKLLVADSNNTIYYRDVSSIGGGTVRYALVYFVDAQAGNNSTAVAGDMTKPWSDIPTAMNAAGASGDFNEFSRGLVYVRPGFYGGVYNLNNYIDVYCDPNAYLFGDFRDNFQAINSNIYGYAKFRGSRGFLLQGDSNITAEFDDAEVNGAFIISAPPIEANVVLKAKYIIGSGVGTGYGNSIRGKTNLSMILTEHGTSVQTFMDIRNSYSGKLRIKIPEIHLASGGTGGDDFRQCIFIRHCDGADIKIEANFFNETPNDTTLYGLFTGGNVTNSKIEHIGNIYALDSRAINFVGVGDSKMKYTGNIITSHEAMQITGQGRLFLEDVQIFQTGDTGNNVVTLSDTVMLQCNDTVVQYQSASGVTFNSLSDTNTCVLMNVRVYNETNGGYFASGVTSWTMNINNSISNIDIDSTTITNTSSPSGFIFDTNFNMIYF
jgi:hypothetical protein